MTQEDKDLLLKDLCARLPYGVKMNHIADDEHSPKTLIGVAKDMITLEGLGGYECVDIEDYKPYLLPLSSMTEEQRKGLKELGASVNSYNRICFDSYDEYGIDIVITVDMTNDVFDWLNKYHFDYRGLIPKGLAIDATGKNIY